MSRLYMGLTLAGMFTFAIPVFAETVDLSQLKSLHLGMTLPEVERISVAGQTSNHALNCYTDKPVMNCSIPNYTVAKIPVTLTLFFVSPGQHRDRPPSKLSYIDNQPRLAQIHFSVSGVDHDALRASYTAKFGKPRVFRHEGSAIDHWRDSRARAALTPRCDSSGNSCLMIESLELAPSLTKARLDQQSKERFSDL